MLDKKRKVLARLEQGEATHEQLALMCKNYPVVIIINALRRSGVDIKEREQYVQSYHGNLLTTIYSLGGN